MQKQFVLRFIPVLFLGVFSCTNIYFKDPVPQSAQTLSTAPDALSGVYAYIDETESESDPVKALFRNCVRIEKANDVQVLISFESRLAEKDMPKLKAQMESQRSAGTISAYTLTDHFLLYTTVSTENEGNLKQQQQYIALEKEGSWFIVSQSRKPAMLLDFKAATFAELSTSEGAADEFLDADSLEVETSTLSARMKRDGYYFNFLKKDDPGWSLFCLIPDASGGWLLKSSSVGNQQDFKDNLAAYRKITPFEAVSDSKYRVAPTDAELERLLAEKDLFQTAFLRRLEP